MTQPSCLPAALQQHTPSQSLRLASGALLPAAAIGYQTWGTLNAARDNVIWVCHALTASSDVAAWWPGVFGAGRALDPQRFFIVCANTLGSCYGSAGPDSIDPATNERYGATFPEVEIGDIVEHQRVLADHLGLAAIELVVGASMGGFQALEWARREPTRVRRVARIASSWRQPPQALAQARLQCEFIRRDPHFAGGHYLPGNGPDEGLALARQLGHLTYRSADELDQRFGRARREDGHWQVLSYLDHQGDKLVRRFDALSYLRLTEAMNRYDFAAGGDPAAALAAIQQPVLVVALNSDQLYYPSEQARLASHLPAARLLQIDTLYGHDGFLVEAEKLDPALAAFRDEKPSGEKQTGDGRRETGERRTPRIPLVVIGATGRVGAEVLSLLAQHEQRVRLVGVANTRAALWVEHGLAPALAAAALRAQTGGSAQALIARLMAAGERAVLVDCTANAGIAAQAPSLLGAGIAVVTPNKIAFAAPPAEYAALRTALAGSTPAGWSATVGAGLPILHTIRRLRTAGDQLTAVEAGLSGTLGHVLTRTQDGATLLEALGEAIELGLAEPDPRSDLSGEDVRRKLSIILREAGLDCAPDEIALTPLLQLAPEGAWQSALAVHEQAYTEGLAEARRGKLRLVYRARWTPEGGAEVGPALVPDDHPLAGARGTENRVVLSTRFHGAQPIVIAGAGAGVRITAAAVLADLKAVVDTLLLGTPRTRVDRIRVRSGRSAIETRRSPRPLGVPGAFGIA